MDNQAYLEQNFDPNTLTMPRLRSILVEYNISYPSSARKAKLVELFNQHIAPQAHSIKAANAKVKRSSAGIEDVGTKRRKSATKHKDEDGTTSPGESTAMEID